MNPLVLLVIGGVTFTLGDLCMKKWIISDSNSFYILGIIIYLVGDNFLALSFKSKEIAVASVIFIVFNVVTLTIAGWFLFDEQLSAIKIFGMLLALAAVLVLELS